MSTLAELFAAAVREPVFKEALRDALGITTGADPLVAVDIVAKEIGIKARVITDAAARGELVIGRAGRKPVVRRSEIDRWTAGRGSRAAASKQVSPREAARAAVAARASRR